MFMGMVHLPGWLQVNDVCIDHAEDISVIAAKVPDISLLSIEEISNFLSLPVDKPWPMYISVTMPM
jgi:hypothetical protein